MHRCVHQIVLSIFVLGLFPFELLAQSAQEISLVKPGTLVRASTAIQPMILQGLRVNPANPLFFDFILNQGQGSRKNSADMAQEAERLIKYFFAALAVPQGDLWVNLSPYEKQRIIPQALGQTALGVDMLAQDYLLKQFSASMIHPDGQYGKEFWKNVYDQIERQYGHQVHIPAETFNKIWIVADEAKVYVKGNTVMVVDSRLKVMMEDDYLAMAKNQGQAGRITSAVSSTRLLSERTTSSTSSQGHMKAHNEISNQVFKSIILPEIEKEINQGANFAPLRQIFHSMILAAWFKKNLKNAILSSFYADKNRIQGVEGSVMRSPEEIYQLYLRAYKKGVFNFVTDESIDNQGVARKYFAGGVLGDIEPVQVSASHPLVQGLKEVEGSWAMASVKVNPLKPDANVSQAMTTANAMQILNRRFLDQWSAEKFNQAQNGFSFHLAATKVFQLGYFEDEERLVQALRIITLHRSRYLKSQYQIDLEVVEKGYATTIPDSQAIADRIAQQVATAMAQPIILYTGEMYTVEQIKEIMGRNNLSAVKVEIKAGQAIDDLNEQQSVSAAMVASEDPFELGPLQSVLLSEFIQQQMFDGGADSFMPKQMAYSEGLSIGIDHSGTNLNIALVYTDKEGYRQVLKNVNRQWERDIDRQIKQKSLDEVLQAIIATIQATLKEAQEELEALGINIATANIPITYAFGFPVKQTAIDTAYFQEKNKGIKGWMFTGLTENENIVAAFNQALKRNQLGNLRVNSLINDTLAAKYALSVVLADKRVIAALLGVIKGTGFNLTGVNGNNLEAGNYLLPPKMVTDIDLQYWESLPEEERKNFLESFLTGKALVWKIKKHYQQLRQQSVLSANVEAVEEQLTPVLMSAILESEGVLKFMPPEVVTAGITEQDAVLLYNHLRSLMNRSATIFTEVLYQDLQMITPNLKQIIDEGGFIIVDGSTFWLTPGHKEEIARLLMNRARGDIDRIAYMRKNGTVEFLDKGQEWLTDYNPTKKSINELMVEYLQPKTLIIVEDERVTAKGAAIIANSIATGIGIVLELTQQERIDIYMRIYQMTSMRSVMDAYQEYRSNVQLGDMLLSFKDWLIQELIKAYQQGHSIDPLADSAMASLNDKGPSLPSWSRSPYAQTLEAFRKRTFPSSLIYQGRGAINRITSEQAEALIRQGWTFELNEFKYLLSPPNQAMAVKGGIDFNTVEAQLQQRGDEIQMQVDPLIIKEFREGRFNGINPVIIRIIPLESIAPLL